jgi:hypothetical protein
MATSPTPSHQNWVWAETLHDSASLAVQAEELYKLAYFLTPSVERWGLREAHMEVLDGIAQNIVSLKLAHCEHVQKARDHFNIQWELWGKDETIFNELYDVCCDSLSQFLHPLSFPDYDRY